MDDDPLNIGSNTFAITKEQHEILKHIKKSCFRLKILNEVSYYATEFLAWQSRPQFNKAKVAKPQAKQR